MSRPISLTAYRALSARRPGADTPIPGKRPDHPVVWCHATSDRRAAALRDLARRLRAVRPDIEVLISFDQRRLTGPRPARMDDDICEIPLESDHPAEAGAFLDHWRPALCLWTGGYMMPNLLSAAHDRGVPLVLVDADAAGFDRPSMPWFPDPNRALLQLFDPIFAAGDAAATRLQRLGVTPRRVRVTPRLQDSHIPIACADDDLDTTTEALAGRPVWFAADTLTSETAMILTAHRRSVRYAHRLLLVIAPAKHGHAATQTAILQDAALRHAVWAPGDPIDEDVQVLVVDFDDAPGLWYRLAPVTLMGSTLVGENPGGRHPFEAAALGSAVLHGPHVGDHLPAYDRLKADGAARLAGQTADLAQSVLDLLAPERAAQMALAGWEAVTSGAWLTDHLLDLAQDMYDRSDLSHESP